MKVKLKAFVVNGALREQEVQLHVVKYNEKEINYKNDAQVIYDEVLTRAIPSGTYNALFDIMLANETKLGKLDREIRNKYND